MVCFPFAGDRLGGSSISALNLIRHLDPQRYRPLVLMHDMEGAVARLFEDEGVSFEQAPLAECASGRDRKVDLRFALRHTGALVRYLRERGVGIVHTNDGRMHATWALPARLAGARLLWHHRADPSAAGLRLLAPWLANRVISVSNFSSPRPGLISAAQKCTRGAQPVRHGCASDRSYGLAAGAAGGARQPVGHPCRRLLRQPLRPQAASRCSSRRSHAWWRARRAWAIVAPMFGQTREGGEEVAAAIAHHGLDDRVRLMGFRYPPEPWIAACDLMLVPAVDEPFGRSLIEAMLLGTPLIAAESGGNPEIIRHRETGYLVPPDDPDAFAQRAIALLEDPGASARRSPPGPVRMPWPASACSATPNRSCRSMTDILAH